MWIYIITVAVGVTIVINFLLSQSIVPAQRDKHSNNAEGDLINAVRRFRADAGAAATRSQIEIREHIAEEAALVDRAKKLIKETDIDGSLCRIWDEYMGEVGRRHNIVDKFNHGEQPDDESGKSVKHWMSYEWREMQWRIALTIVSLSSEFGIIEIFVNGQRVLALQVSFDFDWILHLKPRGLIALVVGNGRWIAAVVELDKAIETDKELLKSKKEAERIQALASQIQL